MPPTIKKTQNSEAASDLETHHLWTVDEVAKYLQLNPATIRLLARQGKIPAIKLGRVWRFYVGEIESWVQSNR